MKRILYVEDDLDARELIQTLLKVYGMVHYEMLFASTLADGIRLAKSLQFDLYLIDERLPDGSGIDLARQIRAFDSRTPLIFHSAGAYADDIRKGLSAGAQAYITKPSDPNEVIEMIETLIAGSENSRLRPLLCD